MPAPVETANPQLGQAEEPPISGLRVLVVDDDDDARELVALTLQSRGAIIHLASSAAEALDSVSREKPDVMIADIGMPREDGYELILKLRAVEREHSHKRLSAIALTSYVSATDRDQALAAGYDLHLSKPVAPGDLTNAVSNFRKSSKMS
jgi:CheY-like chemotaxis protein